MRRRRKWGGAQSRPYRRLKIYVSTIVALLILATMYSRLVTPTVRRVGVNRMMTDKDSGLQSLSNRERKCWRA